MFSLDVAAPLWEAFLNEVTGDWAINDFAPARRHRRRRPWTRSPATSRRSGPGRRSTSSSSRARCPATTPTSPGVEVVRGADEPWYRWQDGCDGRAADARATSTSTTPKPAIPAGTRPTGLDPPCPTRRRRQGATARHEAHDGATSTTVLPAVRADLGRPVRARRRRVTRAAREPQSPSRASRVGLSRRAIGPPEPTDEPDRAARPSRPRAAGPDARAAGHRRPSRPPPSRRSPAEPTERRRPSRPRHPPAVAEPPQRGRVAGG